MSEKVRSDFTQPVKQSIMSSVYRQKQQQQVLLSYSNFCQAGEGDCKASSDTYYSSNCFIMQLAME